MQETLTILGRRYPTIPANTRQAAAENVRRYADIMERLVDRILADPQAQKRLVALTQASADRTMESGRSFTSSYPDTDV